MDIQALLQQESSSRGLTMVPLASVATMSSSQKVSCCCGLVEKVVTESERDCTVLLRDTTGTVHCAIHGDVSARYPGILANGAVLILEGATVLIVPPLLPPVVVVCLDNLSGLLLPEGSPSRVNSNLHAEALGEGLQASCPFLGAGEVDRTSSTVSNNLSGGAGLPSQVGRSTASQLSADGEEMTGQTAVEQVSDGESSEPRADL